MTWKNGSRYFKWGITALLVLCGAISFYYIMFHGANIGTFLSKLYKITMPVTFGLIISYILAPVLNFFEYKVIRKGLKKLKLDIKQKDDSMIRFASVFITLVLFCGMVYLIISMFISQIVPSITNIVNNFDSYVANINIWMNKMLENNPDMRDYATNALAKYSDELESFLNDTLLTKSTEVIRTVSISIISIFKVLWNFIIGLVISIYIMANKEVFIGQFNKLLYALFKNDTANIIINNFHFTHRTFSGFIGGKVMDSFIIGCICFIGTKLMGTPYAELVSVIIGLTNIIPFFGPYLGAIPCALLIFLVNPMKPLNCLYFLIFLLILQQFDGNILGPKILGDSTGLTGFWVLFSITVFGGIFGVFGMIIGVPTFAVIYAAIKSYIYSWLAKKDLPQETRKYINLCAIDHEGLHHYMPEYMKKKGEPTKHHFGEKFLSPMDEQIKGKYMLGENVDHDNIKIESNKEVTKNTESKK